MQTTESRSLQELWDFEDRYSALAGSPIGKVRLSPERSLDRSETPTTKSRAGGHHALPGEEQELVCVVDDDQSVRRGLRRLFKSAGYAAEMFASAEDYLGRESFAGPICLVLNVRTPGVSGLGLQQALEAREGCEQIVFVSDRGDVPTCKQAMKNGAVDFLLKPFGNDELIDAVKRALVRSKETLRKRLERGHARSLIDKLTPREFEVLRLVVTGLLNKQIAAELETAEKTIKVHRGRLMQKLAVTSVRDLVRFSQTAGVLPVEASKQLRPVSRSEISNVHELQAD